MCELNMYTGHLSKLCSFKYASRAVVSKCCFYCENILCSSNPKWLFPQIGTECYKTGVS